VRWAAGPRARGSEPDRAPASGGAPPPALAWERDPRPGGGYEPAAALGPFGRCRKCVFERGVFPAERAVTWCGSRRVVSLRLTPAAVCRDAGVVLQPGTKDSIASPASKGTG